MEILKNLISLIAPNSDIAKLARNVLSEDKIDINIYEGNLYDGVKAAKKALSSGTKVIISRGGTALMIENELKIPVVSINFSGIDLVKTIEKIEKVTINNNCIGIIGSKNLIGEIKDVTNIFGYKLYIEELKIGDLINFEKLKAKILNLHKNYNIDIFIGGKVIKKAASELGLKSILMECGVESIHRAIDEALRLIKMIINETEKNIQFKAIAEYSSEGIIIVNENLKISYINPTAQKFLSNSKNIIGDDFRKVVPNLNIITSIESGKQILSVYEQINKTKIVANYIPIILNDSRVGCIMSFQDVTKIEELEKKIRKEKNSKGLIAKYTFNDILTKDKTMIKVVNNAKKAAHAESTVLITGESGTGKELIAQSIHNESPRKDGPFVAINCAAIPENLLESELFGYVDGAFTGARKGGKPGLFELAHLGTIFVDEIADMPLNLQSHLLRVIQEKEVTRIGDDRVIPVNVRIITATNKDLKELIKLGKFREDLYYRLNVLNIKIPALRERVDDIPYLANHFLEYYCRVNNKNKKCITEEAAELLKSYSWPGNIRELQNFIENIVIISEEDILNIDIMEEIFQDKLDNTSFYNLKKQYEINQKLNKNHSYGVLKKMELESITEVLKDVNGNRKKAAKILGISETTLWRRLKELEHTFRTPLNP